MDCSGRSGQRLALPSRRTHAGRFRTVGFLTSRYAQTHRARHDGKHLVHLCRGHNSQFTMCGFLFTINGFQTVLELVNRLHDKDNLLVMPRTLPVFFVAGAEDPVGEYGKAVERVYQSFLDIGMTDVAMKLYENDRHEILNEVDKETVYEDLYQWITEKMKRA